MTNHLIYWFKDVDKDDKGIVGEKGATLGEMMNAGFPVPTGFIVSSYAYFQFIRENNLALKIKHLLSTVNFERPESLHQVSLHIKKLIMQSEPSEKFVAELFAAYRQLGGVFTDAVVTVYSSATAEDLPHGAWVDPQENFLHVDGEANLLLSVKEAWASLFEPRALFYRHEKNYDHFRLGVATVVQQFVDSEKAGLMYTVDPVSNDKSKIIIEAIYGLGEYLIQGIVTPDHYEVAKKDLKVLVKKSMFQEKLIKKVGDKHKENKLTKYIGSKQKLSENQILELAMWGKKLEHHYYFPQEIEWALVKNTLYIIQTRALSPTQSSKNTAENISLPIHLSGNPASPGIKTGPVKIINSTKEIHTALTGDILVLPETNAEYLPAMKKAAAIITEKGGKTSHAATVSRELGIPAIVSVEKATQILKSGMVITVNGSKGDIYKGAVQNNTPRSTVPSLPEKKNKTATHIYLNLEKPELAEKVSEYQVDGIGLLSAEFIIESIGVHPKKLLRDGKKKIFIDQLAEQLETFCKAVNPRPVVYKASDVMTSDYRKLIGGKDYESVEANPLIGYRGAFRAIHDPEVFVLELEAVKKVRNKMGLKNLWIMIPYVRTVKELQEIKKIISASGLYRSPTFKLWMNVAIPSNVIMLEKFIQAGIDGVSIGSDDLTMLMLGTDKDNSEVAHEFNGMDETVLWAFEHVINMCHKHHISSSIYGQSPSLYPPLMEKLIRLGITSVSVSPDVIDSARETIIQVEKKLLLGR